MSENELDRRTRTRSAGILLECGLILAGERVIEDKDRWLAYDEETATFRACACGFILIGKLGDCGTAFELFKTQIGTGRTFEIYYTAMQTLTGLDPQTFWAIHALHYNDRESAITIAKTLLGDSFSF